MRIRIQKSIFKLINDLKEYLYKQMNEIMKSTQDLDKNVNNSEKMFNEQFLKKKLKPNSLKIERSISQINESSESITNRLGQVEIRISEFENKVKELLSFR